MEEFILETLPEKDLIKHSLGSRANANNSKRGGIRRPSQIQSFHPILGA